MLKISILTPIYGVEKYIEQCARSLFEQSYASIEYIFVDDCTPDKSIGILQSLLKEYPERAQQVRIIHHDRNRGVGAARQTALMAATGDYLLFADSDDMLPKSEKEYVREFNDKKYIPELLFEDKEMVNRIKFHPMALWKTRSR